jgi:ATP-dependent helicase/nuclease subunit B
MSAHIEDDPDAAASRRHAIDAALLRGAVMLTPHPRLARAEHAVFDAARHAQGARLWQPAVVLPWRAWIASLWRDALVAGTESRVLLNDLQQNALWEQVIEGGVAETLRSSASLARMCAGATSLLGAYDLKNAFGRGSVGMATEMAGMGTPDADTFARWWIAFEARCSDRGFLPASHAEIALAEHLRMGHIAPSIEYLLHGFDALTPAQQHLLNALEAVGAKVSHTAFPQRADVAPMLAACDSPADEYERCGVWARHALERAGARVAIVVPDLQECRPVLERALRTAIAPELSDVTASAADAPYEFSTGRPLSALPLIEDALRLLRWCAGEISVDEAGAILRSRCFTFTATPERGAELDAFVLRDRPALRALVSMSRVAGWIERSDATTATALRTLVSAARNMDQRSGTHAFFADTARSLLRAAGWPGTSLDSAEHQAVDRWNELLDRVASLDALGLRVTFTAFLSRLTEAAEDTTFAPENTGSPLQVTTVAEAIGRDAEALWFLHADERTWPARQRPHPMLPLALQHALHMPGADLREEEQAARRQLGHLVSSTASAIFSYARTTGEMAQRPSPLVLALGITTMPSANVVDHDNEEGLLELVEDVAPLPPLPEGVVAGGVGVLSTQALCGFRAFAEKRLFSRELEVSAAGLTAGDRGEQVHSVLEAFWKEAKDQARLKTMSANRDGDGVSERDHLLRTCIDVVIPTKETEAWEASYLEVQRQRLFLLLKAWLDFEATRPPFTVNALEKTIHDAAVGPLRLELRVDRIDTVTTGGEEAALLIDYKTGSAVHRKTEWMGERPTEPQLPVYAIAGGLGNVQGIAFGAVKVGRLGNRFEGLADDPKMLSARATAGADFYLQLETWEADLTQLATDFAEGRADVAPKEYPKTCDYCGQRMLCRLDAATLLDVEDMDDEDDEDGLPW